MTVAAPQIVSRQYKSRRAYEKDVAKMMRDGWAVQSSSTTESRRLSGCLFGIIGYWLFPKRTVFHVTYIRSLEGAPTPPIAPPPPPPPGV